MKTYQDLEIRGKAENITRLLDEIAASCENWPENKEWREEQKPLFHYSRSLAFDTPLNRNLVPATLFLFVSVDGTVCNVGNIVPDRRPHKDRLEFEEYNAILQAFVDECVRPRAEEYQISISLSRDEVFLEDTLSPDNMALLQHFAALANKNTGSSHPYDYNRWVEFIAASARDHQVLPSELLRKWLNERGFPGDVAMNLAIEYKFGVDVIRQAEAHQPQGVSRGA